MIQLADYDSFDRKSFVSIYRELIINHRETIKSITLYDWNTVVSYSENFYKHINLVYFIKDFSPRQRKNFLLSIILSLDLKKMYVYFLEYIEATRKKKKFAKPCFMWKW